QIPPQGIRHAAFFLRACVPFFPPESIHVMVVDPGVGGERALLAVEWSGQKLLVPDNGCWTLLTQTSASKPRVWRLTEARFWRQPVSATFHGRDILAPAAGHWSLEGDGSQFGPEVRSWVELDFPDPKVEAGRVAGEVAFVDHFGNLITNIAGSV